jgi:hypothetical protein
LYQKCIESKGLQFLEQLIELGYFSSRFILQ